MRKAKVWKSTVHGRWTVEVKQPGSPWWPGLEALAWVDTHMEAMFLAQLLADPERYIRQAEQRAWADGHKAGALQEYFRVPGVRNTYREEDQ